MAKSSSTPQKKKRIFCNYCKHETNHILYAERSRNFDHEAGGMLVFSEDLIDNLWLCAGCETATLEQIYTNDQMVDPHGKEIYEFAYFPKRNQHDVEGRRFKQLPSKLDKIYRESVQAFNSNLDVLCAAGLRSLIEGICDDKGIKAPNLQKKIEGLKGHHLPHNIVDNLHSFRFMGNTAVHELTPPKHNDLLLAIEVSEDLLNFLYELDYKARRLPNPKPSSSAPIAP